MKDGNGDDISSKEYMENALKEMKGLNDQVELKNRVRR